MLINRWSELRSFCLGTSGQNAAATERNAERARHLPVTFLGPCNAACMVQCDWAEHRVVKQELCIMIIQFHSQKLMGDAVQSVDEKF